MLIDGRDTGLGYRAYVDGRNMGLGYRAYVDGRDTGLGYRPMLMAMTRVWNNIGRRACPLALRACSPLPLIRLLHEYSTILQPGSCPLLIKFN